MRQFKILAMLFLMLVGSHSHAFEYSNLCEVMKTATPQSKGLASQITPGLFSCNEDQALSVIYSLEGGNSTALSTIKPILKSGGMSEDHFSTPNPVLDAFTSYMWNMIIIIVGALTGYIVYRFLVDWYQSQSIQASLKNNTTRIVSIVMLIVSPWTFSMFALLFATISIMFSNKELLADSLGKLSKVDDYNVIRPEEKMVFSANVERINDIATEDTRTIDALFANNRIALGEAGYTKEGMLKIIAESGLEISKEENSWIDSVNVDVTTNIKNIVNLVNEVHNYPMRKTADYSMSDRALKGYPASVGKFVIGSNGGDVETLTGQSLNDGTMKSMFEKGAKASTEMLGGSSTYLNNAFKLGKKYYAQINDDYFQTSSMNVVDGKFEVEEQSIVDDSYAKTKELMGILEIDQIGVSKSADAEVIKAKFAANILSGYMGHDFDKNGASFRNILNAFKNTIVRAKLDEYCTTHWFEHEASRRAIAVFNELPNDTKGRDLNRMQGIDFDMQCATLNASSLKIENLGSPNESDAKKFKAKQLAYLTAFNRAYDLFYIGVKKALQENKEGLDILTYEVLSNVKRGILGAALSSQAITQFESNKNLSSQILKNSFFVYWDNADVKNYDYVNKKILCGITDVKPNGADGACNLTPFAPVDYKGLYLSPIMNITPSTLTENDSFLSKIDLYKLIFEMIGLDFTSIKEMAGFDPSLSIPKGRAQCASNPQSCENNYHIGLAAGMYKLGSEMFDFGVNIILIKALTGAADGALDGLMELIGNSDSSSSAGINTSKFTGKLAKFLGTLSGKTLQIVVKSMDIIMSAYLPLGYVFAALGFFCKYIMPMLMFFMILGQLIKFVYFVIFFKFIEVPVLLSYSTISGDSKFIKIMGWKFVYLISFMMILMLFMLVMNFMGNNLDARAVIWGILGMSDGTFIGDILSILMVVVYAIYTLFMIYKHGIDSFNRVMKTISNEDAIHDDSVSRMQAFIMHPQLQNALHAGIPMLGNAFDKVVKNNAWAKSYDVENRKRKEEIRKQFSEEERKNSTTTEGEA